MRVAVWEFFCCGAARMTPDLQAIQREGQAMLLALVEDLLQGSIEVSVVWDAALGPFPLELAKTIAATPETFAQSARRAMETADRVLVIAPESDGVLLEHYGLVSQAGQWTGASAETIRLCSDKLETHERLVADSVPTVPTSQYTGHVEVFPCVIKPRFGAGCENTFVVRSADELAQVAMADERLEYVVQPLISGTAFSVSAMRCGSEWAILPPVIQRVGGRQQLEYLGGELLIGEREEPIRAELMETIHGCLASVSAANGWIGIDLIEPERGLAMVVDINPRLTTSYVGYRRATQTNLALKLLQADTDPILWDVGRYAFSKSG